MGRPAPPRLEGGSGLPAAVVLGGRALGARGLLDQLRWLVGGKYKRQAGYALGTIVAVDLLAKANPEAARWWRENTPLLLRPVRHFLFPAKVCLEEPSD